MTGDASTDAELAFNPSDPVNASGIPAGIGSADNCASFAHANTSSE